MQKIDKSVVSHCVHVFLAVLSNSILTIYEQKKLNETDVAGGIGGEKPNNFLYSLVILY